MRFAPILFNFVAGVSANDIWLNWDATDCRGKNSVHCANATFGQDTSVCMSFGGIDIAAADRDPEDVPGKFHVYKME
ncbi:Zinc finger CCCH domain-containing protein 45 [Verticillium dahliae VDG1]|nr:Zinc finger CCCH domain-containing protein 45 [Verticillium dahliae VDG1]